jgi:hypothetical protein
MDRLSLNHECIYYFWRHDKQPNDTQHMNKKYHTQHNDTHHNALDAEFCYADCRIFLRFAYSHYAKCHYDLCQ